MGCDMCGSDSSLVKCNVEGVVLNVCLRCSSYGNVIKSDVVRSQVKQEVVEGVVDSVGSIVRGWREKHDLTQKELAVRLNVKESLVKKIENGYVPSLDLARKLEKIFGCKLVVIEKVEKVKFSSSGSGLTIGDMFK